MSNPVIVFSNPDNGHVAVCTPVLDSGLTVEQISEKDVPQGAPRRICEASLLPQEGTFFEAWVYDETVSGAPVTINVEEAHNLWKNEWRRVRDPILAKLDVQWMRAMELGDTALAQDLAGKKQTLRDVTLTFLPHRSPGQTVDQFTLSVKAVWPTCLTW
jgi:hypothetical protein